MSSSIEPREAEPFGAGSVRILIVATVAAGSFVLGFVALPWIEHLGGPAGGALRALYRPLCHQLPGRSIEMGGATWGVCSRCAGLYLGGAVALAFAAIGRRGKRRAPPPAWLLAASLPTILDVAWGFPAGAGLSNVPRLALALPLGFVAGLFLAEGLVDLGGRRWTIVPRKCCVPRGSPAPSSVPRQPSRSSTS